MFCPKCGSKMPEGCKFCSVCGERLKPAENNDAYSAYDATLPLSADSFENEPTVIGEPAEYDEPTVIGDSATYNDETVYAGAANADNGYYYPPTPPAEVVNQTATGKKKAKKEKKKKGPKKVILSIVAVLLSLILVSGGAFGIFYATNPEFQIAWAIERTLIESKGFDFNINVRNEYWGRDGYVEWIVDGIVDLGEDTANSNLYLNATCTESWEEYYEEGRYDWSWYKCEDVYDEYGWYVRTDYYYDDGYISQGEERWIEGYEVPAGEGFISWYGAFDNGNGIVGFNRGENNVAYDGLFFTGTTENLLSELEIICEENVAYEMERYADLSVGDAFTMARELISDEKVNKDVIKELFDNSLAYYIDDQFNADMFTYNETVRILADFFIRGINEDAFKITDTYNEDGIRMRDVRIDINELMQCLSDFIDDNDELGDLLKDINPDILDYIDELADEEFEEDIKFTIGTKNGYFCYFQSGSFAYTDFEIKITNINKPTNVESYYSDIVAIAKEWDEMFFTVETYADVENALNTYYEEN